MHAACRIIMQIPKEVKIMKKLSEVCKIVGVTRRTLQEYDKIGLLKPTSKTESGYWLYDDTAIQALFVIQVFVECGYKRKAIKSLFAFNTLDVIDELDHLIETLEEKRKRIDGMINTIRILEIVMKLPESTLLAIGNFCLNRFYKDKSFSSCLEDSIVQSAEYSEADNEETQLYMPFVYNLIAIGCFLGTPADEKEVQITVEQAYKSMMKIVMAEKDDSDEELTDEKLAEASLERIQDVLSNPELKQMIDHQFGNGATEYIVRAVQLFSSKKITDSKASQKGDE